MISLDVIEGHARNRRCSCGSHARWTVADSHGAPVVDECNGCLVRRLQALYTAATGYAVAGGSLPLQDGRR